MNISDGNATNLNFTTTGNLSLAEHIKEDYTFLTKVIINLSILPILFAVGIFGNISSIIVFLKKKKKKASTIFIIGLAFCDLSVLLFRLVANIYSICHLFFPEEIRFVRLNSFIWIHISETPHRWGNLHILYIVIERVMAVWFPMKARQWWTPKKAVILVVVGGIATLTDTVTTVDAINFVMNEVIPVNGSISTPAEAGRYIAVQGPFIAWYSFGARSLFDMLPIPLVLIFNVAIIIGLRKNTASKTTASKERKDKEARLTRMLLIISVLYFFLCSPFTIYLYFVIDVGVPANIIPFALYQTIEIFYVINSVINFIMYGVNDKSVGGKYLELWGCKRTNSSNNEE